MIRISTFLLAIFCYSAAFSQSHQWTWMAGNNTVNQPPVYGTQGTAAAANTPGGVRGGVTWTANDGTLWLYGGYGLGSNGTVGYLTSLWQFNPQTSQWKWVSGNGDAQALPAEAVFGMKGVPASFTQPGSRLGATTWMDAQGTLWLYGGFYKTGRMNDLWKFNPTTNMWTWVSGDNTPSAFSMFYNPAVRGTQGVAAPDNQPGSRSGATGWTDKVGNLWLFGGIGWSPNNGFGDLNDLWMYNPTTGMWTWIGGSMFTFQYSIGGPGARTGAIGATDADGNFWLFGGTGASRSFFQKRIDDLWKFNPTTRTWTLMSGDLQNYTGPDAGALAYMQSPVYGTKGEASPLNKPGAYFGSLTTDKNGKVWLLGMGELWKFDPASTHWTWMETMTEANYGTKGVTAATNKPGARVGSMLWADAQNTLWLLGGANTAFGGSEYLNDMWKLAAVTPAVTLACTPSKVANTTNNACAAVVNGIDPVLQPAGGGTVTYTLSGATMGTGTGSVSGKSFNKGMTTVTYALTGTAQTCSFTVTVTDNVAPVLSALSTSATTLWPANHQMQEVKLNYTSTDNCAVTRTEISVTSNEPQNGLGDGDTPNDWEIINNNTIRLRAERSGKGNGRTYTVLVKVWDAAGNGSTTSAMVHVPKNKKDVKPGAEMLTDSNLELATRFTVKALPNISNHYFTLVIQSEDATPVTLRVMDDKGRLVEAHGNKPANGVLILGQNYRPGMYYAEIVQGVEKRVIKLIKQ